MSDNYFEDLFGKTFEPMMNFGKEDQTALDNIGSLTNTAFNVLDIPSQMIGDGLDFAWDNTLGALTGTQDMFTGDDLKIVPEIASMFIPGIGAVRGAKYLKNLQNVGKYEKMMSMPYKNTRDNVLNSLNGFIADFGKATGPMRAERRIWKDTPYQLKKIESSARSGRRQSRQIPDQYELSMKGGWDPYSFDNRGGAAAAAEEVLRRSEASPVPLYRGGNDIDGWFYTPDRRIAKKYAGDSEGLSLFQQVLGRILDTDDYAGVIKLPKGTPAAPGIYYGKTAKRDPFREVFVAPETALRMGDKKYKPQHTGKYDRSRMRREWEDAKSSSSAYRYFPEQG